MRLRPCRSLESDIVVMGWWLWSGKHLSSSIYIPVAYRCHLCGIAPEALVGRDFPLVVVWAVVEPAKAALQAECVFLANVAARVQFAIPSTSGEPSAASRVVKLGPSVKS